MQVKITKRWLLLMGSIAGIAVALLLIFFVVFDINAKFSFTKISLPVGIDMPIVQVKTGTIIDKIENKIIPSLKQAQWVELPIRLKISKINIDAPVKYVGLTPDGAMDVTKTPYDVSWYSLWPRPGQKGSAVIAGHYGTWKNGAISVFNRLNELRKGDKIDIKDGQWTIIHFVVRETKIYKLDADASDVFHSYDGKSHLNLITCIQDKITKKYPNRLVVFTDRVE